MAPYGKGTYGNKVGRPKKSTKHQKKKVVKPATTKKRKKS
tara:strand:+ start:546 stop:665 length:120 start_codon:yes stop_codon:yes gene_type:complete